MLKKIFLSIFSVLIFATAGGHNQLVNEASAAQTAETVSKVVQAARSYRQENERKILAEYRELLRFPNDAFYPEDIRRAAEHIMGMLRARDIKTQLLDVGEGSPAIYGELMSPGAEKTIVFYVHYDGQPVTEELWVDPPYSATIRNGKLEEGAEVVNLGEVDGTVDPDWRIYARSASDDKAPIAGILTALDAMRAAGIKPSINIKFFFDGQEEQGSANMPAIIAEYRDLLEADAWIFCDGPVHQSGRKKLSFGVRGGVHIDLTTFGPMTPVHSGHFGNWAPNPVNQLVHLLASMRDINGNVLIDGFYDDVLPPSEAELEAVAKMPKYDEEIKRTLGLGWTEGEGRDLSELILWPALNFQGIQSGPIDQTTPFPARAKTAIVGSATASIGVRLVPEQEPREIVKLIEDHVASQGYRVVYNEPDKEMRMSGRLAWINVRHWGYAGARTPLELSVSQAMIEIMNELTNDDVVLVPSSGGSLPIAYIRDGLDVPLIMLPIANYDNNQHAPNENIRIGNFWEGIEIYAAVLAKIGDYMAEQN